MYNNPYNDCQCGRQFMSPQYNTAILDLNNKIRQLWEEHIIWTRLTIINIVSNSPDTKLVSDRLLKNATDFAALFATFYGPVIANQFGELMRQHLLIAADLVNAAKKQDANAVATIEKKWHQNADDIAKFLNSINPYWNANEIQRMMDSHLALTKAEAVAILTNKYAESIALFDEIEKQALEMADLYIEGLVNQFPNNFV